MNRWGKTLRVLGGILILINIISFFLPITQSVHTNYPTKYWSQLQYVTNIMGEEAPYFNAYTPKRLIWMIFLIVLPLLLSALAGIWGLVGDDRQIVSPILSFIVIGLYIGMYFTISRYYPNRSFRMAIAGTINLVCSSTGVVLSVLGVIVTPPIQIISSETNPQVGKNKQEKLEPIYKITENKSTEDPVARLQTGVFPSAEVIQKASKTITSSKVLAYTSKKPRGVIVGLTGEYAGAEITFKDGEVIRLGRLQSNDLVFNEMQIKVSREHCSIRWDVHKKLFYVMDYSSIGTFRSGSDECLPKHKEVALKPGTIISIGDDSNKFRLE